MADDNTYSKMLSVSEKNRYLKALLFKITNPEDFSYFEAQMDLDILDRNTKDIFFYINNYKQANNVLPTREILEINFPTKFHFPDDFNFNAVPNELILENLKTTYKKNKLLQAIENFAMNSEFDDVNSAIGHFQNQIDKLNELDKELEESFSFINDSILVLDDQQIVEGFSYGIPSIDKHTGGIKPGEYIIVLARPKSNKSFFTRFLALNLLRQGADVFYCSFEFKKEVELKNITSLYCQVDPLKLATNNLSAIERTMVFQKLTELSENYKEQIFEILDSRSFLNLTPKGIFSAIEKKVKRPEKTVIIIDQVSQMYDDERSMNPNAVYTNISKSITNFVSTRQMPVIALYQANRSASEKIIPNEKDIQWSDRPLQDCHVALGIGVTPDLKKNNQRYVKTIANRLGEQVCSLLDFDIKNGICKEYKGEIEDPDDVLKDKKDTFGDLMGKI